MTNYFLESYGYREAIDKDVAQMWKKDGVAEVPGDQLTTELLPENYIAKEIISTAIRLPHEIIWGYLESIAREYRCNVPEIIEKAADVISAIADYQRNNKTKPGYVQ